MRIDTSKEGMSVRPASDMLLQKFTLGPEDLPRRGSGSAAGSGRAARSQALSTLLKPLTSEGFAKRLDSVSISGSPQT